MIRDEKFVVHGFQRDYFEFGGLEGGMFQSKPGINVDVHCTVNGHSLPHTIHFGVDEIRGWNNRRLEFNIWLQSRLWIWRQSCLGKLKS